MLSSYMHRVKIGIKEKDVDLDHHLFHQVLVNAAKIQVEKATLALVLFLNLPLIHLLLLRNQYSEEYYIFLWFLINGRDKAYKLGYASN